MSPLNRRSVLKTAFAAAAMASLGSFAAHATDFDMDSFMVGKWVATQWSKYPMGVAAMADSPQASLLMLEFQAGGVVTKTVRQSFADGSVKEQAPERTQWRIGASSDGSQIVEVNNGTPSSPPNWVAYAIVDGSTIRHVAAGTVLKRTK